MVYNVDLKKARGPISFGIVFTLAGLLFLVIMGAILISSINKKNSLDSETDAINITWDEHYDSEDGSTTYSPNYEYIVDGKNYVCNSNVSSSSRNAKGIVYYDSKNPSNCMTDFDNSSNGILAIFLLLPIVFIVIGGLQIRKSINKTKVAKELAKTGVLVKNIPYQLVNSNISVNNVPLKCICINYKFPDGVLREIKSEALKGNVLSDADGMCDLLYDSNNYNNYYIDFDITTTGFGSPNIIHFNQTNQEYNGNNNAYPNQDYNVTNNYPSQGYDPNNKF